MPSISLFEIEYSLEFALSQPSKTKIQTAIIWLWLQQKSKKIESVRLRTSIFRIYFFQSKLIDCIPDTFF